MIKNSKTFLPEAILISDPNIRLGGKVLGSKNIYMFLLSQLFQLGNKFHAFVIIFRANIYLRADMTVSFCILDPFPL